MARNGLDILRSRSTMPKEIAAIIANGHPPFEEGEVQCDRISCEECWLAWLTAGKVPVSARKPDPLPDPVMRGSEAEAAGHHDQERSAP